jgi:hypothetical protein
VLLWTKPVMNGLTELTLPAASGHANAVPPRSVMNFAPIAHSITSSARPRSESGMVRPSALAVLRFMISSTFVDC